MGVNLNIDIEGWDQFANGVMKSIWQDAYAFPKVYRDRDFGDAAFRPADFAIWR